jgi:hypothetical protein
LNVTNGDIEAELTFSDPEAWNRPVAMSPDGRWLVVVAKTVEVWSLDSNERVSTLAWYDSNSEVPEIKAPRDVQLVMRTSDRVIGRWGRLAMWDIATGQIVSRLEPISAAALHDVSPGGTYALARIEPWSLTLVDTRNAQTAGHIEVPIPHDYDQGPGVARFSPNGREFAVVYHYIKRPTVGIYCFDMTDGRLAQSIETPIPTRWKDSGRGPPWRGFFDWLRDGSGWRVGRTIVLRRPSLRHSLWGKGGAEDVGAPLPEPWKFEINARTVNPDPERLLPIQLETSFHKLMGRVYDKDTVLTGWGYNYDWRFGALPARKH